MKRGRAFGSSAMISEAELLALRLLVQQPGITVMPDILDALIENGLVVSREGSPIVTARGHGALLDKSTEPPPDAA